MSERWRQLAAADPISLPTTMGILSIDYVRTVVGDHVRVARHTWVIDRKGDKDVFTDTWVEDRVLDTGCKTA